MSDFTDLGIKGKAGARIPGVGRDSKVSSHWVISGEEEGLSQKCGGLSISPINPIFFFLKKRMSHCTIPTELPVALKAAQGIALHFYYLPNAGIKTRSRTLAPISS